MLLPVEDALPSAQPVVDVADPTLDVNSRWSRHHSSLDLEDTTKAEGRVWHRAGVDDSGMRVWKTHSMSSGPPTPSGFWRS